MKSRMLRALLVLAGSCYAGPGTGALLVAQMDWLIFRVRLLALTDRSA